MMMSSILPKALRALIPAALIVAVNGRSSAADAPATRPPPTRGRGEGPPRRKANRGAALEQRVTINDLVLAESTLRGPSRRDGTLRRGFAAAWPRSKARETRLHLWMTHLDDGSSVQLTRGSDEVQSPRFSPDGGAIAFLSTRKLPPPEDEKRRIRRGAGEHNSG